MRSVTTDANGLYRIENLRPGTYTITFNLPGFSSVKRDGVELPSNFTSTINADLKVGAMEETVTVSGQSPVVDVQSNSKAQVLSREVLDAVPTAHTIQGVGQLVVGVTLTAPDVGGSQAMQQTYFTVHGLGAAQTSLMMDGMIINGLQGDGAIQTYTNDAGNQEMVYQTGGGTVDSPTGGVKINMIPKEGGNRFSGSLFQGYESSTMQGDNLTSTLAANGVKTVDKIGTYNDTNFTLGGPIKKDSLWFFGSGRFFIVNKPIANTYVSDGTRAGIIACANALAGRGTAPLCPQGVDPQHQYSGLVRMTWQISPRNKLSGYYDRIHKVRGAAMCAGRRPDDVVGGVELAAVHDEHDQVHVDRQQQAAGRGRLLEQHRALQQPVSARHRAAVRQRGVAAPTRATSSTAPRRPTPRRARSTAATRIATTCRPRRRT